MSVYTQQGINVRRTWILIFLFIGLISAIFYGFGWYFGNSWIVFAGLFISIVQAVFAYYQGDKLVLMTAGAQKVSLQQAPTIHHIVENISVIAGIPKPTIYISPDPSPNAFATGRDPKHASICPNQGILDLLNKNELEGVIAHELAHIKNRDILVMTVAMVLSSVIAFIADIGLRFSFFGNRDDNEPKNPLFMLIFLVLILLAPVISLLIQMAISRSREYLADATAVTFTRYPKGLADALQKLYQSPISSGHYSTATNHLYIAPPKKKFGEKIQYLFSTHPPIQERIQALNQMA